MEDKKYKGNPVYWQAADNLCIITYNQFAFQNRYTLYLNGKYTDSSDSIGALVKIAKKSYFYKKYERD